MKVSIKNQNPLKIKMEAVVIPCTRQRRFLSTWSEEWDRLSNGMLSKIANFSDFPEKLYETRVLYPTSDEAPYRIILVNMGKEEEIDREKIRGAFSRALQFARNLKVKSAQIELSYDYKGVSKEEVMQCAVEGAILGHYRFLPYKTSEDELTPDVQEITIGEPDKASYEKMKRRLRETLTICESVIFARDLISAPGNEMTPTILAEKAKEIAKRSERVKCRVLDRAEIRKLGMNAFLGVAQGSHEPPKFIILEYQGAKKSQPPIVLVGKGLTFDSGGISLKPAEKMEEMKSDMSGAAAVLGAIRAIADLKMPVNCVGLIAATENLPGGSALKPGDILKSYSGKTIEVINTDAEGRLTLADALSYGTTYEPAAIVDIATLTGACIVALGEQLIGLMGNDEELKTKVKNAGEETGEFVWELPLWEHYEELIKSDVADIKNTGGRPAGTITAGLFLQKFVKNYPWVHLDIAGSAWQTKDRPYIPKGAAGIGVRLLVRFIRKFIPQ